MTNFKFSQDTMAAIMAEMQSAQLGNVLAKWDDIVKNAIDQVQSVEMPVPKSFTEGVPVDVLSSVSRFMKDKELTNFMHVNKSVTESVKKMNPQMVLFTNIIRQVQKIVDDQETQKSDRVSSIIRYNADNPLFNQRMQSSIEKIKDILDHPFFFRELQFPNDPFKSALDRKYQFEHLAIRAFIVGLKEYKTSFWSCIPYLIDLKHIQNDKELIKTINEKIESVLVPETSYNFLQLVTDEYFVKKYKKRIIEEIQRFNPATEQECHTLIRLAVHKSSLAQTFKPVIYKMFVSYMEKIVVMSDKYDPTGDQLMNFVNANRFMYELKAYTLIYDEIPKFKFMAFEYLQNACYWGRKYVFRSDFLSTIAVAFRSFDDARKKQALSFFESILANPPANSTKSLTTSPTSSSAKGSARGSTKNSPTSSARSSARGSTRSSAKGSARGSPTSPLT